MQVEELVKELLGPQVEPVEVVTLKSDASSRRYHRVILPQGIEPESLVVMELPEDALKSDEITSGGAPDELPFLNVGRYLAGAGLRVPRVLLDAVDQGAVLLEDLGDQTFAVQINGMDQQGMASWYSAAVDLLAEMHGKMWPIPQGCQAETRCFDYDLLRWELDHYREWGAEALQQKALAPDLRAELDQAFDHLAQEIAALPQGFVHRDYQSRNLMVLAPQPLPNNLAIIDFQDALIGPRIYDLVALLNDSYIDVSPDLQNQMIERYAANTSTDPTQLKTEFALVTVQRKLKDGGRFVYVDRVRGNPTFLQFVDGSFARVRRALAGLPGHEPLKSALARTDPPHL